MPDDGPDLDALKRSDEQQRQRQFAWRQWAMAQAVVLASTRAVGSSQLEDTAERILAWTLKVE